ncbi:MAG: ABC transporter ATP-binding protein [Clostridiales bacterium]|nr:ABC transporter ATP-binding protein [Clostridiales bacterium]
MRMVLRYIKPHLPIMCLGLLVKFIGTITDLALPYILSHIIDNVVPTGSVRNVFIWGGMMFLCAIICVLGNIIANRMASKVARNFTCSLRHDLFAKIEHLSCNQTDSFTIPSLLSRLTSDTYHVHNMVGGMQRIGVRAPILLIGGIMVTLFLEPVLTLVLLGVLPLLALVVYFVTSKGVPLYTDVQTAVDGIVRKVQENMTGVRVIKALSKTDYERERFDEVNRDVVRRDKNAGMVMNITNPVMNLLLNTGLTAVVVLGAFRVNAGLTKPGKIIAFLSYFTIILNALMMVTRMFMMYSRGAASARRIQEVMDAGHELDIIDSPTVESDLHIEFDNITFSYNKKQPNLENLSFGLKKGQTLGIIGATGSGKSTIINLLMRFYDVDEGTIRIDGSDIRSIPHERLHSMFGVVFQNDFLAADTIAENIRFGRDIPDEDLHEAARAAQAEQFISEKEGGYDHILTVGGANLSGGQKQRLLISRALAGKPDILILDDSSSALDYKTDASLRAALREYTASTKVIVAQRVSSIKHADIIIVLDDGRVIGQGRHEELMKTCDSYREIAETQMGDGIE